MNDPDSSPDLALLYGDHAAIAESHAAEQLRAAEAARAADTARTADATEEMRSILATHLDPSLNEGETGKKQPKHREVVWVRPTELIARSGATASGRGIDLQKELVRQARTGTATFARRIGGAIKERASRLGDLSLHGRDYPAPELVAERSEMGLR